MVLEVINKNDLKKIFDETALDVMEFYLKRALLAQPERLKGQAMLPIQIPKEHIEQYVVQAIGATGVGAGSYGVDVIKDNEFGADVKMLSCKISKDGKLANSESGETSLAQKFVDTGENLDVLFEKKKYNEIVAGWKDILYKKIEKVICEKNVKNIYYLFVLRAKTNFYLCGLKVNPENIKNIKPSKVILPTSTTVWVDNFIDSKLGSVKVYKSKKRIELRLRPKYWVDENLTIDFPLNFELEMINAREIITDGKMKEFTQTLVEKVF